MKLTFIDYMVFGFLLLLAVIIDPTDLIDFGTPVVELALAVSYFLLRKRGGGKS